MRLLTRVGVDGAGQRLLAFLEGRGLDVSAVQRDGSHATGRVVVHRDGERNDFEIVEDAAWDYLDAGETARAVAEFAPAVVCFGTLALRRPASRRAVLSVLADMRALRFCDLNLRPPWFDAGTLSEALTRADVVKLNREELSETARLVGLPGEADAGQELLSRFGLRTLVVTDGARGSFRLDRTPLGIEETVRPGTPAESGVVDTVGAGDAFAAVVVLGLLEGWTPDASLARADDLARRILAVRGALPSDPSLYVPLRAAWRNGG